jgi:predicted methyltransferase
MIRTLGLALLVGCGGAAQPAEAPHDPTAHHDHDHAHGMHHHFTDAERWAKEFDAPDRAAWQKPDEVVQLLGAAAGDRVADIGAGTGYFAPYLARAVGASGTVLELDSESAMVDYLRARIAREQLAHVEAGLVREDDPQLADKSVARILIVDTWHHIDHRDAYAAKLFNALACGGAVLIVDFTAESPIGPPREMRLAPATVVDELAKAGFAARVVDETLPHQYAVLGTRACR